MGHGKLQSGHPMPSRIPETLSRQVALAHTSAARLQSPVNSHAVSETAALLLAGLTLAGLA